MPRVSAKPPPSPGGGSGVTFTDSAHIDFTPDGAPTAAVTATIKATADVRLNSLGVGVAASGVAGDVSATGTIRATKAGGGGGFVAGPEIDHAAYLVSDDVSNANLGPTINLWPKDTQPTSESAFYTNRWSDPNRLFEFTYAGALKWGPGSAAADTSLSRAATAQLRITPTGNAPASVVTGGALNVTNDGSTGAGAVFSSTRGADAGGRLVAINQSNAANTQQALRVQNAGTGITVSILGSNTGGNEVLDVVSNSLTTTVFGVTGDNNTQGVVKLTHNHPASQAASSDAAGAILRLNWLDPGGSGSAVQGIYMYSEDGNVTTGDLVTIYNGLSTAPNTERLRLDPAGQLRLPVAGTGGGLLVGADVALYRQAADRWAIGSGDSIVARTIYGGTAVTDLLRLIPTTGATTSGGVLVDFSGQDNSAARVGVSYLVPTTLTAAHTAIDIGLDNASVAQAIAMNAGGGIRALQVGGTYTITGVPDAAPFLVFNFGPTITFDTVDATSKIRSPRIYQSNATINLPGTLAYGDMGASPWVDFRSGNSFAAAASTATAQISTFTGFYAAGPSVNAGWLMTTRRGVHVEDVGGTVTAGGTQATTGRVTNNIGIDIEALTKGATANISLRSLGSSQVRIVGSMIVGATGAVAANVALDLAGPFAQRLQALAPAGAVNDQSVTTSFLRVAPTANSTYTGFSSAGSAPVNGQRLTIINVDTTFTVTLSSDDTGSTAANRMLLKAATQVLGVAVAPVGGTPGAGRAGGSITLQYDSTTARWREV